MGVKLCNNQSPVGIRFCCISLESISRARWKLQDSATVQKARESDHTASLTKDIILPSNTLHSFSSTQQQMQKNPPPNMQNMEFETAGQAAVTFERSVQGYTEVLLWDCHSAVEAHSKSRTKGWVVLFAVTTSWCWGPAEECWSLTGDQQEDTWKWNEAPSGEAQTGHQEKMLHP